MRRHLSAVAFASILTVALIAGALPTAVAAPGGTGASLASDAAVTDAAVTQSSCEFPVETTDATGETVSVASEPDSVVALQPSDAQIAYEIGAADKVVGLPNTSNTDYLENRSGRVNVKNDDGTTNVERVVGTEADLVLAANVTPVETVRQLRQAGMTVYHFDEVDSIDGIYADIDETGRLVGECEGAAETVNETRDRIERVRDAVAGRERPSVLYYFFDFTTGNGTHVHDVVETVGGENVAAEAGLSGYVELNREVVAEADPEWIVYPSDAQAPQGAPYNETTAVERDQVVEVTANDVSQPGPRVALVVEELARAFHPEAFENGTETPAATDTETATATEAGGSSATETPTPTEAVTSTPTDAATPTGEEAETATDEATTPTPTAGDGPGFGVAATAIAALAAALVAARRKEV
ncbi:PGF-CTERM-anchored ABC transporter substrate-binding protein [Halomicrobium salinisoli]|uniref:PGF-CTERM-anchored ABC transporter substrate-binding protein n=1 Tax=Halomicrobium salinisoli TaxID=2878391 RepID=UPI001CEFEDA8|nr:PGF-CTERM-anchored ABC transporter substrate-binding protein [Halomicrobium salinisoli]